MSYVGDYCASKCKVGHKVDDMISKIMMNNDKLENYDDINDVINEKSNSKNDDISDNSSKHEFGNSKYNNDDISDDSRHKNSNKRYNNHHIKIVKEEVKKIDNELNPESTMNLVT
ncbi:hypothetical protein PFLG_00037 [Plasmodium falciparum RAJ116]|uniref:Uncharacterized protein n=1 Tax=Plasmodium falciparum RAJ116 TaxID=580058 RepID=A0A0L0CS26_PLAFA|nr:hypothetical protein PFLG_00037 [Plasmodium falciparum RAJ116]